MKSLKYVILLMVLLISISCEINDNEEPTKLEGRAFGTTFHITYYNNKDFSKQMDSLFNLINNSLSTYITTSDISRINNGDTTVVVDDYFMEVFDKSLKIYNETAGVFDPTIGVLVNAWGFGPEKNKTEPDSFKVKKLLNLVAFNKVQLNNRKIVKQNDSIYFDFNAIAKGYAVDVAGRFLEAQNVDNYLIEIGGEIRARGKKRNNKAWKAGIEDPHFDGTRSVKKVVELNNEVMATSGSYRKFKIDSTTGKKYIHILNPKTGYPTQSNLLSVSIMANLDCADVDGYATAIMAMPLANAKQFLNGHKQLKGFLIYSDVDGNLQTYTTENF